MSVTVSIITPCFNGAKYLRRTLESALNQTQRPLEIIVIDDGSTDESAAIAESFGAPVRVIRQKNQGESVARNMGICEALGEYGLFLDADDILDCRALEELGAAAALVPNSVAQMGCAWFENDPGMPYSISTPTATDFFPGIIQCNLGPPHTWLVPLNTARDVGGFRADLQIYEDWEFWCRVGLSGAPFVRVDYIGAYYRRHSQSQLANSVTAQVARGHKCVIESLCLGILSNARLLESHGDVLFWSTWTAIHRGRQFGISWQELQALTDALDVIARRGPDSIRTSRYARLVRVLGVRCAETIRNVVLRSTAIPIPASNA